MYNFEPKWIRPAEDMQDVVPQFEKRFRTKDQIEAAYLSITGLGVYVAQVNGGRVGEYIMAPGWTSYKNRLQVQTYDVTDLLKEGADNVLTVLLGKGWYRSRLVGWQACPTQDEMRKKPAGLLAELEICYANGASDRIVSDGSWTVKESQVRFSEIYDGEIYDASFEAKTCTGAVEFDGPDETLIDQEGEEILEVERVNAARIFRTPAGDTIVDFGQEVTGYVEVCVNAAKGETVDLSFGEVLDKDGNFYNENYRSAKAQYHYTCKDGQQTYKPLLTFFGFRYVRINEFPGGPAAACKENFKAIVVSSDLKRTGYLNSSDPLLNRLFENTIWSQKGNFLDVPTDCPQRDERLGWTGDAQVFAKAACYNYDTERFYRKWLNDLAADQRADGGVGFVIPDLLQADQPSAGWGDAATIVPWTVYLMYGDAGILSDQFETMKAWVGYITSATKKEGLWTGGSHFADWLGLDAPVGSYKGSTREDLIASAYYAYSTQLVIKAGKILGEDVSEYEALYKKIKAAFQNEYPEYLTQTECVLAAWLRLAKDPQAAADQLAKMVEQAGVKLQTGFVGTPYLLHVLSTYGYTELAYSLLLRKEYPSWLYPVLKGATTIWEHWDGIMEDGNFWSADMNSFNHYAYGSVVDWVYAVAAGINPVEDAPGFEKTLIAPHPDRRLGWLEAKLETRNGLISSKWTYEGDVIRYEITTPVETEIVIDGAYKVVGPGSYTFYTDVK